jgi:RecA/RadA recombinase
MSMQARVESLKQHFEQLFPGKWLTNHKRSRQLATGVAAIDTGISRGIARGHITEWRGPCSSGKRTLLRNAIMHWCAQGLNVAYIDCEGTLYPADWASIETPETGKFWIVRPEGDSTRTDSSDKGTGKGASTDKGTGTDKGAGKGTGTGTGTGVVPLVSMKNLFVQEAIWSADQFVRSSAFDVVILDLGLNDLANRKSMGMGYNPVPARVYARLQRGLDKSKAALIIVSDSVVQTDDQSGSTERSRRRASTGSTESDQQAATPATSAWGCHARFLFNRGFAIRCQSGLNGIAMIAPGIRLSIFRDGLSQELEVNFGSSVPNRLFTHTRIPDRRTSKG